MGKPRDLGKDVREPKGSTIREEAIERYLQLEKQKRWDILS
jgi:hypothetical protein